MTTFSTTKSRPVKVGALTFNAQGLCRWTKCVDCAAGTEAKANLEPASGADRYWVEFEKSDGTVALAIDGKSMTAAEIASHLKTIGTYESEWVEIEVLADGERAAMLNCYDFSQYFAGQI